MIIMKKLCKFILRLIGLGAIIGGVFAYLKSKGYITVSTGNEDEDYDDFSSVDTEGNERTYINVNTDAMKSKAKEMAQDMKDMAEEYRANMVESICETDEELMMKYLEGEEITVDAPSGPVEYKILKVEHWFYLIKNTPAHCRTR